MRGLIGEKGGAIADLNVEQYCNNRADCSKCPKPSLNRGSSVFV